MAAQQFMLDLPVAISPELIDHRDGIMVMGSCFTEHIGDYLAEHKFQILQNPNGILFDPVSISNALTAYTKYDHYKNLELFNQEDTWFSWQHHSRFSGLDKEQLKLDIVRSQQNAYHFLKKSKWLIITLGTAFHYKLAENNLPVANCHKVPASRFRKHLLGIEEINSALDNCLHQLFHFNPDLRVIFTVSPVRHIKDGIIENNRSKSRLLEVVHHLVNKFDRLFYFPAYELVIDVLRDYRFYKEDMVHPNNQAVQFVIDKFLSSFVNEESRIITGEIDGLIRSMKHRPFQPQSLSYKKFLLANLQKIQQLKNLYPHIDLTEEENYFNKSLAS
jgi:hypothetical protein